MTAIGLIYHQRVLELQMTPTSVHISTEPSNEQTIRIVVKANIHELKPGDTRIPPLTINLAHERGNIL